MKRTILLAMAGAMLIGQSAMAQQEEVTVVTVTETESVQQGDVTYVPDPAQGLLLNSFKDNWFITAEGGANILFSHGDSERDLKDRFSPQAAIYIGKWFTPTIGARLGFSWLTTKGLADTPNCSHYIGEMVNGKYKQRFQSLGPAADLMVNLTNWWCGYKADRVYNATFYAGAGFYWNLGPKYDANGKRDGWENIHDRSLFGRIGLINSFRLSDRVNLFLDLRWQPMDNFHGDEGGQSRRIMHDVQANIGFTVNLGKSTWDSPVVPVYPEPENCDALRARLAAADARIADLEQQLRDCLNRPQPEPVVEHAPLATVYYPIGVSKLTQKDINVLGAVANVMKANPDKTYTLTGWADNYTGTDAINVRLRKARAAGVEKQLLKFGVPAAQISTTINNSNLCDMGEKFVALDRAVTIDENQK
ncbi:MAG: OmpA family protein [Muribaculaceae bacterium]